MSEPTLHPLNLFYKHPNIKILCMQFGDCALHMIEILDVVQKTWMFLPALQLVFGEENVVHCDSS